jgi:hypothetical protein
MFALNWMTGLEDLFMSGDSPEPLVSILFWPLLSVLLITPLVSSIFSCHVHKKNKHEFFYLLAYNQS